MDDFAHLLLGYILFRFMRIAGLKAGRLELAAIVAGSILPDILWSFGRVSYAAAHTLTYYLLVSIPFLLLRKTRLAAGGFAFASTLHILIDSFTHARATVLFAPISDFAIVGKFNYWEVWWVMPAYWLVLLLLLAISAYLEKEKTGKITLA